MIQRVIVAPRPVVLEQPEHPPLSARLGQLPFLCVTMAMGLILIAVANMAGRQALVWAEAAFWAGLLVIFVPTAIRLFRSEAQREERIGLVLVMGIALFISHFIYSPLSASAFDEFLHLRTAQDMIDSGRLFTPNSLLPVSPYYPGLENITSALQQMSGISIIQAGFILLAAARITFMLSLFLFLEQVTGSARMAGLAVLVYMANPRFLYFDAQFSYESLGLPLAALALYLTAWRERVGFSPRWVLLVITVILLGIVVSHHITSLVLVAFLVVWSGARIVLRGHVTPSNGPAAVAFIGVVAIVGWFVFVATPTVGYLAPQVTGAATQIADLLSGGARSRELFRSAGGDIAPIWERIVGFASVATLMLVIVGGIPTIWRRFRHDPLALTLWLVALSYPASLLARLTATGAEVSARTPEFLFLGVGFVVAVAVTSPQPRWVAQAVRLVPVVALGVVVFVGGIIVGIPQWQRLPGPYLVSADSRSIEPNAVAAAEWARQNIGTNRRFIADRVNRLLMGTYGDQQAINPYLGRFDAITFYESPTFKRAQRDLIKRQSIEFVIADRRLTTSLPVVGFYFQRTELAATRTDPLSAAGLAKFDTTPGISRTFDNGDIRIYDVTDIELAP